MRERLGGAGGPPPRVLIVDDEPLVRTCVRRALELAGYECEEAGDGQQALTAFRLRPADLVVCDLLMPGKDGLDVIRGLHREFIGATVLVMTGGSAGAVDLAKLALALGATEVLAKPFNRAALLAAVGRALGRPPRRVVSAPPDPASRARANARR